MAKLVGPAPSDSEDRYGESLRRKSDEAEERESYQGPACNTGCAQDSEHYVRQAPASI
jgi:hypothetical protein